jgi:uncharacterized integral membrane protein
MSYRLNTLAIAGILTILLLLINNHRVQVQIFFVSAMVPLGGIMSFCMASGVAMTLLFLSLAKSYTRLAKKKLDL